MKNIISTLNAYFSLIAIIPLVLGGLWQVLSLSSISVSYIRFFSVAQQVADGAVILLVLSVITLTILLVRWVMPPVNKSFIDTWTEKSILDKIYSLFIILCVLIAITILFRGIFFPFTGFLSVFNSNKPKPTGLLLIATLIMLAGMLIGVSLALYYILLAHFNQYFKKLYSFISKSFFIWLIIGCSFLFVLMATIFGFFNLLILFHSQYALPHDLRNIRYAIDKYCADNESATRDSLSVVYMNDKYLFIQDRKEIVVEKFDYLFDEETIAVIKK